MADIGFHTYGARDLHMVIGLPAKYPHVSKNRGKVRALAT